MSEPLADLVRAARNVLALPLEQREDDGGILCGDPNSPYVMRVRRLDAEETE